jgi:hypothetical protein
MATLKGGPTYVGRRRTKQETRMTTLNKEIAWERDFDAAQKHSGGKHLLVDFSAAPM